MFFNFRINSKVIACKKQNGSIMESFDAQKNNYIITTPFSIIIPYGRSTHTG